jgi:hypothetical protein
MSTDAQTLANQANAQHSTGPATDAGKARVSQNATKLGLFSATAFILPDEHETYDEFCDMYTSDLAPANALEGTLACEIVQAAWRLRRCTMIESTSPSEDATAQDLERLQASIDRARAAAQRSLHRNMTELRHVQTERVYRSHALPRNIDTESMGQASCKAINLSALAENARKGESALATDRSIAFGKERYRQIQEEIAKQTQSAGSTEQTQSTPIARNAQCPCASGEKYKRCCGKSAPPVLSRAA